LNLYTKRFQGAKRAARIPKARKDDAGIFKCQADLPEGDDAAEDIDIDADSNGQSDWEAAAADSGTHHTSAASHMGLKSTNVDGVFIKPMLTTRTQQKVDVFLEPEFEIPAGHLCYMLQHGKPVSVQAQCKAHGSKCRIWKSMKDIPDTGALYLWLKRQRDFVGTKRIDDHKGCLKDILDSYLCELGAD
jgi:hypothetical protein